MKPYLFIMPLCAVISCQAIMLPNDAEVTNINTCHSSTSTDILYCTDNDTYLIHRNDPYRLSNFQDAIGHIIQNQHEMNLTKTQIDELSNITLTPTHYAVSMFPKTEEQEWRIENMDDVKVSYFPFDYFPIGKSEVEDAKQHTITYYKNVGYNVIYEDVESTEGFIGNLSINLPILYTVWPIDKPFPEDIEYSIDYPIYIPASFNESKSYSEISNAIDIIEKVAIELAIGKKPQLCSKTKSTVRGWITVNTYDDFLKCNVPMSNLKVRLQLGSKMIDFYTNESGQFSPPFMTITDDYLVGLVFQHNKWKLTTESSTEPCIGWRGTIGDIYGNKTSPTINDRYFFPLWEAHRAVDFYYNGKHQLTTWHYQNEGIRIIVSNEESDNANSLFYYPKKEKSYIKIYNNNKDKRNYVLGSTLHELGHFTHYSEQGGYNNFTQTNNMLIESYASYVGWYLCNTYYEKISGAEISEDSSGQSRQSWTKTSSNSYSPLFVDLIDNFDQSTISSTYNKDTYSGFPHSEIRGIAADCKNWYEVRDRIYNYFQNYRNGTVMFNQFIEPYDYWFSNN